MQFRTRKSAFIAMMLSDHASSVFPNANQIFHQDGTLTVKRMRIGLRPDGSVRVLSKGPPTVKVSQPRPEPEVSIPGCAQSFGSAGNEWGHPNYQFSAQQSFAKMQPDGTLISIDHDTIQGYDDHGPIPRPDFKPDPKPDQNAVQRGVQGRVRACELLRIRKQFGI